MEKKKNGMTNLEEWAYEIINYCSPIAEKQDLEYYPFQSPINIDNTEVLIVGINPRSNGNHNSQSKNSKWEYVDGRMTPERLLKGNPYFDLNDTRWRFFSNLKQIDYLRRVIENDRYTYMNYFYFSSCDAIQMRNIEGFQDIVTFSKKALVDLIGIINPKIVIILGVSDGLDLISDVPVESILQKGHRRILTSGYIQSIKLYAIPHPSRNYAYDIRDVLSKSLNYFENEPHNLVSSDEFHKKIAKDIQGLQEIKPNIKTEISKEVAAITISVLEKKWEKFADKRFRFGNSILSLTIAGSNSGYIAIRLEQNNEETAGLINEILKILEKHHFEPPYKDKGKLIWLGTKNFRDFGNTSDVITEKLIPFIEDVIQELEEKLHL